MKELRLLVWITQLGLSVAAPLAGFILLAAWLHNSRGWGGWVLWAGVILGILSAVRGLRFSLRILDRMEKKKSDPEPPPISFNDQD